MFAFFVLAIVGPLLMFTPRMAAAKGKGLAEYGLLAQHYVENFEQKWVCREPFSSEELLGTGDIQSAVVMFPRCVDTPFFRVRRPVQSLQHWAWG